MGLSPVSLEPKAPQRPSHEGPASANEGDPPGVALYECAVMHHRLAPREHRFTHHIFLLCLDLDTVEETAGRVWGFARNRRAAYEFRDRDHLMLPGLDSPALKDHVLAWVRQRGLPLPDSSAAVRVTLLTLPRVFGHIFNPVSFYLLHEAATGRALCAVAEVRNTFGELKPYLIEHALPDGSFHLRTPKHFYVSPFSSLDLCFDFRVRVPDQSLDIRVDDYDGSTVVLRSVLSGRRLPLTTSSLWRATIRCPLVTLKVVLLIHWHAFLLWLKRVPWHAKADRPAQQSELFHPHSSLSGKKP